MIRKQTLGAAAAALAVLVVLAAQGQEAPPAGAAPAFDRDFYARWSDGRAEVAAYDLVFPRYGEERRGVAVAIFVKEPFSEAERVKPGPAGRPAGDVFEVMKLNLAQDFPTGFYDYQLMTSTFIGLEPSGGRPAGAPAKVSFSCQEWCGHVYQQLLFDADGLREEVHSYFDGEGDRERTLPAPEGGLAADALLLWARGWVAPRLEPGAEVAVPFLPAAREARLLHRPLAWGRASASRGAELEEVQVPAGTFAARTYRVAPAEGTSWTVQVEDAPPHRVLTWATSAGERAELLGAARLRYWELQGLGQEELLRRIGLSPRPPRTP